MSRRPRLLDLFCCAGGCSEGYARAGFDVEGVDLDRSALKHYPYPSRHADALEVLEDRAYVDGFDVIHASPPCHAYSRTRALAASQGREREEYPDLVEPVRDALTAWAARTGGLWVMENVPGAPMPGAVELCGRSFGLRVKRHRLFESNALLLSPGCACDSSRPVGVYGRAGDQVPGGGTTARDVADGLDAMGFAPGRMPWRTLTQAIPPPYTHLLGDQLVEHLRAAA